jgi:hypothetical protein
MQVSRSSLIPGESVQFPVRTSAESIPAPIVADFAEYALKSVSRATACLFKASAACSMVGRRSTGNGLPVYRDALPIPAVLGIKAALAHHHRALRCRARPARARLLLR